MWPQDKAYFQDYIGVPARNIQEASSNTNTFFTARQLYPRGNSLTLGKRKTSPNKEKTSSKRKSPKSKKSVIEGLDIEKVKGDGNCLYSAVAFYLNENVQDLRNRVADTIENNPDNYRSFLPSSCTAERYAHDVRHNRQYADHIEIEALMRSLGRAIVAIGHEGDIRSDIAGRRRDNPIFVYYTQNNHNEGHSYSHYRDGNSGHYDGLSVQVGYSASNILERLENANHQPEGDYDQEPRARNRVS